jgi:hypothetical protein
MVAFLGSVATWWIYFDRTKELATKNPGVCVRERGLASSDASRTSGGVHLVRRCDRHRGSFWVTSRRGIVFRKGRRLGRGVVLSGSGQTATEPFELEAGLSICRMTHQANRNFIVWLLDSNGRRVDLLVNEIGSSSGSKAVQIPSSGTYLLQVEADGPWTIQVEY